MVMGRIAKIGATGSLIVAAAAGAQATGVTTLVLAKATTVAQAAPAPAPIDQAQVDALAETLRTVIAGLGADASPEDVEGAILLAVDNAQQPGDVVMAALEAVRAQTTDPKIQKALASAIDIRRRNGAIGTGALADGGDAALFGAGNNPAVAVGGGSTVYS